METPHLPRRLVAALLVVAAPFAARSQTTVWNDSSGDHYWSNAGNWSGGIPTSSTVAEFGGAGSTIYLGANVTNAFQSMNFTASDSTYILQSDTAGTVRNLFAPSSSGSFRGAYEASNSSLTFREVNVSSNAGSSFAYNGSNNSLLITDTGTRLAVAYNAGFSIGSGNGSAGANSNNTVTVQNGGQLLAGLVTVGGKGDGNSLVVTGADSRLEAIGLQGQTNFNLNIGNATSATNNLQILDGADAEIKRWNTNILGGYLIIGRGSTLVHSSTTAEQSLFISSRGTLYGAGSITATYVSSTASASGGTGAHVHFGETDTDYGILSATLRGPNSAVGEWRNTDLELNFQIGDLSTLDGAIAGENYDLLDISGNFVLGGTVNIDLTNAVLGGYSELQLIAWSDVLGSVEDLSVHFINGTGYGFEIRSDGLYLTPIPEPGTMALAAAGVLGLYGFCRRKR